MSEELMQQIFLYECFKDKNEFYHSENDLAYYTSASTLFSILDNKEVWLRGTMCMNDYQEIRHTGEYIIKILQHSNNSIHNQFIKVLERIIPEKLSDLQYFFTQRLVTIVGGLYLHTYIMCFTEHDDRVFPDGNLQMFNSYGQGNGACLIFDKNKLNELDLPIYKVHYSNEKI